MANLLQFLVLTVCFFNAAAGRAPSPAPGPAPVTAPVSELMKQTCGSTPYPDLCVDALLPFPESQSADTHGLAELAIRAVAFLGADYWGYIAPLRNTGDDCIHYCLEEYENAIALLDDSTGLMEDKQYELVEKLLEAAIASIDTCESDCKAAAMPNKVEFSEKNIEFRHLCSVVLSIVNLLPK